MQNDWFTVETIDESTFAISEYGHWEKPHSYLFKGSEKSVLLDTGLGIGNIKSVAEELTDTPIVAVVTHAHWDHTSGLHGFTYIGVHELDKGWLEKGLPIPEEQIKVNLLKEPFTKNAPPAFSVASWKPFIGRPTLVLKDEDEINLGNRILQVIHTPGHSPGHICIYEEAKQYLATGDLLYEGKLDAFYESTDPAHFRSSIEKISKLKVNKLLPGHNKLDLPVSYIEEAKAAFNFLKDQDLLKHGTGIHNFKNLLIHL
jgi:glyoxylase-like metal-dependent hydrolase (beta-lactamase superfamily II)